MAHEHIYKFQHTTVHDMQDSEHTLYTVNLPENQYQCIPVYSGEVQFFQTLYGIIYWCRVDSSTPIFRTSEKKSVCVLVGGGGGGGLVSLYHYYHIP